jgi:poly(3-hydroxybutyrate) depolymerase
MHLEVPGAGHYGIFSGSRWRTIVYPQVVKFIQSHAAPVAVKAAPIKAKPMVNVAAKSAAAAPKAVVKPAAKATVKAPVKAPVKAVSAKAQVAAKPVAKASAKAVKTNWVEPKKKA